MRIRAIGQGGVQAGFVATLGYVSLLLLNLVTWLVEQTPGQGFTQVLQTTSRIWLNAHFVPIQVAKGKLAEVFVPSYEITLVPLALSAFILWAMFRAGRNLASQEHLGFAWGSAIAGYLLLAIAAETSAHSKQIFVLDWQGAFLPTVIFAVVLVIASVTGEVDSEGALRVRLRSFAASRYDKLPWAIKPVIAPALRAGTGVVVALLAISAFTVAFLIAFNWVDAIRLYQSLELSFFGTLTISLGQLALLPNLIVYGASWFTGVGFSLGSGSMVSPLAVELGPLPPLPMLSALPINTSAYMIVAILVPVLAAFFATLLIKSHTADLRFNYASATSAAIALGVGIGLVAATELAILADFASGSIGPKRMSEVGVNPLFIFIVSFIEVSVASVLAAFFSARPEGVDTDLVANLRRLK
ncbi:MAG: hypothetical protein RIQ88_74 [Actinomycetota bacterium]|jgi:Family of unknown function (DUF6350)